MKATTSKVTCKAITKRAEIPCPNFAESKRNGYCHIHDPLGKNSQRTNSTTGESPMSEITYTQIENGYKNNKGHTITKGMCGNQIVWFVALNNMPYTHKPTLKEAKVFIEMMEGKK
jgi:hypothetical protein